MNTANMTGMTMGTNSKIEWCDATFNPWIGCTKVSPGCKNCYAETWSNRYPQWRDTWGPAGTRLRTSPANWRKPHIWNRKAEGEGRRYRVFCGSLCDVFEAKRDQHDLASWRSDLFRLIEQTPGLDWLLLTKRPENWPRMIPHRWDKDGVPDNVWIGTSVEDQVQANGRIAELIRIQNVVRFLNCEPLLGPIDLNQAAAYEYAGPEWAGINSLVDWVIVGGESGPNRRRMDLDWARSIRDQCRVAGVPFFMKQVDKVVAIPDDLLIREFPETEGMKVEG